MPQSITHGPGCYLVHFYDPATNTSASYVHAKHYLGWSTDIAARLEAHAKGSGARLMEVIRGAGLSFVVAKIWPGGDRLLERRLKGWHSGVYHCPICKGEIALAEVLEQQAGPVSPAPPAPPPHPVWGTDIPLSRPAGRRRPMATGAHALYFQ